MKSIQNELFSKSGEGTISVAHVDRGVVNQKTQQKDSSHQSSGNILIPQLSLESSISKQSISVGGGSEGRLQHIITELAKEVDIVSKREKELLLENGRLKSKATLLEEQLKEECKKNAVLTEKLEKSNSRLKAFLPSSSDVSLSTASLSASSSTHISPITPLPPVTPSVPQQMHHHIQPSALLTMPGQMQPNSFNQYQQQPNVAGGAWNTLTPHSHPNPATNTSNNSSAMAYPSYQQISHQAPLPIPIHSSVVPQNIMQTTTTSSQNLHSHHSSRPIIPPPTNVNNSLPLPMASASSVVHHHPITDITQQKQTSVSGFHALQHNGNVLIDELGSIASRDVWENANAGGGNSKLPGMSTNANTNTSVNPVHNPAHNTSNNNAMHASHASSNPLLSNASASSSPLLQQQHQPPLKKGSFDEFGFT